MCSQDADALEHRGDDHLVKDHVAHPKAEKGSKLSPPAWQTEIVAAYFIKNSGRDLSVVVAEVAKKLGIAEGDAARHTIQERILPFVNTILSHHTIRVSIGDVELQTLGPSNSCGISSALHNVHVGTHQSAALTLGVKEDMGSVLEGVTHFASPTGWGIISDIDDTIKVTLTPEELGILKSTFVDEPEPISGMPELYSHMASLFSDPPFFYLSASPYNLYPFLRSFRSQYYPAGTTILRDASWQNLGGLIASLTKGVQEYKVDRIKKIHAWFPSRQFICIGDSTQKDPESYGEIARTYPGWVKAIFIRKVSGVVDPGQPSEAERNSDERFAKAFKGLDSSLWTVFTDPQEVRQKVDALATNGL